MHTIRLDAPVRDAADVRVPGDKSISHRALMIAAVASGQTEIRGANAGADVASTAGALRALGIDVEGDRLGRYVVRGAREFADPASSIDCGNSGTTMRLLAGLIAGRANAILDGDASLRRRPMERIAAPLRQLGADIRTSPGGMAPIEVRRVGHRLVGTVIEAHVPSAQVKSAVLLAGLFADGVTAVVERVPTRDHTERMLRAFGADVSTDAGVVRVKPAPLRTPGMLDVPGDLSQALYFVAAALVRPGARVRVEGVGVNPTRRAALDVLRAMGAEVRVAAGRDAGEEPTAAIEARGGATLRNVAIAPSLVPALIDEFPALCALAASSSGDFVVDGAAELRTKESDRIETTAALLRAFGADVSTAPDGLTVRGGRALHAPAFVATGGDHRIGMSAAILAAACGSALAIEDAGCIATSYPGFERAWNGAWGGA